MSVTWLLAVVYHTVRLISSIPSHQTPETERRCAQARLSALVEPHAPLAAERAHAARRYCRQRHVWAPAVTCHSGPPHQPADTAAGKPRHTLHPFNEQVMHLHATGDMAMLFPPFMAPSRLHSVLG